MSSSVWFPGAARRGWAGSRNTALLERAVGAAGDTPVSATRRTRSEPLSETMNTKRLRRSLGLRVSWGVKAVVLGDCLPDQYNYVIKTCHKVARSAAFSTCLPPRRPGSVWPCRCGPPRLGGPVSAFPSPHTRAFVLVWTVGRLRETHLCVSQKWASCTFQHAVLAERMCVCTRTHTHTVV